MELGFVMDFQEAEKYRIWNEEYMPAFKRYALKYGNIGHIPRDYVDDENNVNLGRLISDIRTKHTQIPPEFHDKLMKLGWLWSNTNLAIHVHCMLQNPETMNVQDENVKTVLRQFIKIHALMRKSRRKPIPFGKTPMDMERAMERFKKDQKKM